MLDYNRVGDGIYGLPKDLHLFADSKLFGKPASYPLAIGRPADLLEKAKALTKGREGPNQTSLNCANFSGLYDLQGYIWSNT